MKKTAIGTAGLALVALTVVAAGCGSKQDANEAGANASGNAQSEDASGGNAAADAKKIIVGTGTQFPKVCFLDENGKLTGFDVELVKEIDKRLPDYEFEFQTLDFSNLLLSLETKKIDFVAHEMEKNPDRAAKYLFNKEAYAHWKTKIIVPKDNNATFKNLDDLKGKKVLDDRDERRGDAPRDLQQRRMTTRSRSCIRTAQPTIPSARLTTGRVDATLGADFTLP